MVHPSSTSFALYVPFLNLKIIKRRIACYYATSAVTGVPTITPATPVASTTTTSANLASEPNLLGIQRSQYSVSVIVSATYGRSNADWSGQNRELV
jgi:hypothetical protein